MATNLPKSTLLHEVIAKQDAIMLGKANIAPSDGNQYVMKDGVWTKVSSSFSGTLDNIPDGTTYKRMSATEQSKLAGIEAGAEVNVQSDWNAVSGDAQILNKPSIPTALGDLADDSTHRLVTDTEKSTWNNKSDLALGETNTTAYRGDRGKTAYDHSQTAHAPSDAQKNSDITKEEIEAKLTGEISSHSHASSGGGLTQPQIMARSLGC